MSLVELDKRISFVDGLNKAKKRNETRETFYLLHSTIRSGTFQGKRRDVIASNNSFNKYLDDCFSLEDKKINNEDIDDLGDFMEVMNVKK